MEALGRLHLIEGLMSLDGEELRLPKPEKLEEPVLKPGAHSFNDKNVYNPAAAIEDGVIYLIYRAESQAESSKECTGRLGLAWSSDGVNFQLLDKPIMIPEEPYERIGVEDPRLVRIGDTWVLTYTGYDGDKARLCLATYRGRLSDLREMEEPWRAFHKQGPIFQTFPPFNDYTKSGAILPQRLESGRFKGKYVMLFGVVNVWLAHADDPTDVSSWEYLPEPVLTPREGYFDDDLVEGGPPLVMTSQGILAVYNSAGMVSDQRVYKVGAALLDPENPTEVIARTSEPIMVPEYDWERYGYVDEVVFLEAMVERDGIIHLYYGGADRNIGLARWRVMG